MSGKFAVYGVLFLVSSAVGGVADISRLDNNRDEKKEPEKKPNIVKDYVCLRDGELCHPSYAVNRGLYVSCSNGVPWEQQCPRCTYHPLNCPTKSLWFDGEKCDWASPRLASQPCIDRLPLYDIHNGTKEGVSSEYGEQESAVQSLQSTGGPSLQNSLAGNLIGVNKEVHQNQIQTDKGKWPGLANTSQPPIYYKSPKSGESSQETVHDNNINEQDVESAWGDEQNSSFDNTEEEEEKQSGPKSASPPYSKISRKKLTPEPSESEFVDTDGDSPEPPAFINPEDDMTGSKIVRLSEPIYALVDSPEGDGKQVLVKVSQPFVFENAARTLLPALNALSPYAKKN